VKLELFGLRTRTASARAGGDPRVRHVAISLTVIAAATKRPEKVIRDCHFMNPRADSMKLVEIIRGHRTSDETSKTIGRVQQIAPARRPSRRTLPWLRREPAFMPMINEACFALRRASPPRRHRRDHESDATPDGRLALTRLIGL